MSNSDHESCDHCGKELSEPAGKDLTSPGLHRAGKVFCSGHCEIEDWWDNPTVANSMVEI